MTDEGYFDTDDTEKAAGQEIDNKKKKKKSSVQNYIKKRYDAIKLLDE